MKQIKYEDITIENIEQLLKTGYITEICCNGDTKTITILEEEYLALENVFKDILDSMKSVVEAICEVGKKMAETFSDIFLNLNNSLNKKMTKKKFVKLLQSEGIQRNQINKIIKNNKEKYTYLRYYRTLEKLSKDERPTIKSQAKFEKNEKVFSRKINIRNK